MTIGEAAERAHALLRRHSLVNRDGVGEFVLCASRLPWGGVHVKFRPDFDKARWWPVPATEEGEGLTLFSRMMQAENAWQAMSMLRAVYAEDARLEAAGA